MKAHPNQKINDNSTKSTKNIATHDKGCNMKKKKQTEKVSKACNFKKKLAAISTVENKHHGNRIQEKRTDVIRLFYQNINSLKNKNNIKWLNILKELQKIECDVIGMVETSANWNRKHLVDRHNKDIRSHYQNFHLNTSKNRTMCPTTYLPGGTAQIFTGDITGRISTPLNDDKGLRRWSGHKCQLKNDLFLFIITAYRVCKASNTLMTSSTISSFRQQYVLLRKDGDENPNPRKQFIVDLNSQIKIWKVQPQDHLIVMLDANKFTGEEQTGISHIMRENN